TRAPSVRQVVRGWPRPACARRGHPTPGLLVTGLLPRPRTRTVGLRGVQLPHAHVLRGDLDAVVRSTELERGLEGQLERLGERLHHVGGRGAHVGELLLAGDVDVEVLGARVDAHDVALVDVAARFD